jgi:hypothetical protein
MVRYRLDDLGAFQFEWLVQSLLKIIVGPGLESWGGRADHGIDVFSEGPLYFPNKAVSAPGPFIFQVKFVQNANAAGADPNSALKNALQHEKSRIRARTKKPSWKQPRHYILVTNALFTPEFRQWAMQSVGEVLVETELHFLSGADVCDFLDQEPTIRQSFPQILGLRDLNELIQSAVNKKEIERSRSAIDCAGAVAPVFVPTRAYHETWRVLSEHRFAVLEGPAEMGKSAIAWMIALAQVSNGWQAVYCGDPDAFFSQHDVNRHQIFVADDAFGLTEYDPARSQKWEKDLALVTRRLDAKHWLLWTSRKHILERGLKKLDFQREFPNFPHPSAVIVNAEDLTELEKALILYRHTKKANLKQAVRTQIRQRAQTIVNDANLTPERVRILTKEVLPKYNSFDFADSEAIAKLWKEIDDVISNPTERSKKTFGALPASHKWALISMLEVRNPDVQRTGESYRRLCPENQQEPFDDVIDQLTDSFIKRIGPDNPVAEIPRHSELLTWTHPSYRDLVIDELGHDPTFSNRFLSCTTLSGITLAVSSGGGKRGERQLPFLTSERAWQLLAERCGNLAAKVDLRELPDFLETLSSAIVETSEAEPQEYLRRVTSDVCEILKSRWNESGRALSAEELDAYDKATVLLAPLTPAPSLFVSWASATKKFLEEIKWSKETEYFWPDEVKNLIGLAKSIAKIEPRFLRQSSFPENYRTNFEEVLELARMEAERTFSADDPEHLRTDFYRLSAVRDIVAEIYKILPDLAKGREPLLIKLEQEAEIADEAADNADGPEPDYDVEGVLPAEEIVHGIDSVFFDL